MVASVNGVFEDSLSLPKIVEGGKVDDVFDCWIFDIEFTERGCVEETAEGRGLKPSYIVERERERLEPNCASLGRRSKKGGSHV
jgi:hypothetical protein